MPSPREVVTHPATDAARRDLERLNYPPDSWVLSQRGPDALPLLDVLVVGGGMMGQTVAFALRMEGVLNVRVIDRAPHGYEGPWLNFARMPTLRSPKHVTGPDLGIPTLTFRAWYEAAHGPAAWEPLYKIVREDWPAYLLWLRTLTGVTVENGVALAELDESDGLLRAELLGARDGEPETVWARHVVLALGRGDSNRRMPAFPSLGAASAAAARGRVFHACDAIDFARLRGARVAVIGAGATAFDNAGTALEAGAAEVVMFIRRPVLPTTNYYRPFSQRPWPNGYALLSDDARWDLFTTLALAQVPPPFESVQRCEAFPQFTARLGEPVTDLAARDTAVAVTTPRGVFPFDAAIVCTGFNVSPVDRPELAGLKERIATWGDRVGAERARQHPVFARHPYLGPGFELTAREPGAGSGLGHIRVFDGSAGTSLGPLGGDIPGVDRGATRIAAAIAGDLFVADAAAYTARLRAHTDHEMDVTRLGAKQADS